jgi:hypothetical protein
MNRSSLATASAFAAAALLIAASRGAATPARDSYPTLEAGHTVLGQYDGGMDTPSGPRVAHAPQAALYGGHVHLMEEMYSAGDSLAVHPTPRPGITAEHVITPERLVAHGYEKEAPVYAAVARYPQIIDGLYCYCHCAQRNQHYSLLTCFESGHAANCITCLGSGELAARLAAEGKTLAEIRAAVDEQFGRRAPLPH